MEPWQKLVQILCEIWVEEDIKSGKLKYEECKKQHQPKELEKAERDQELAA